jgi:hypothetical protein
MNSDPNPRPIIATLTCSFAARPFALPFFFDVDFCFKALFDML